MCLAAHLSPTLFKHWTVFACYSQCKWWQRAVCPPWICPTEWWMNPKFQSHKDGSTVEIQKAKAASEAWLRPGEGLQLSFALLHRQIRVRGWHLSTGRFPAKGEQEKQQALCSALYGSGCGLSAAPPLPYFGFLNILNPPSAVLRPLQVSHGEKARTAYGRRCIGWLTPDLCTRPGMCHH